VIRDGAIWAIHQSATLFVALAVQIVALLLLVDVFSSAVRVEAVQPQLGETVSRVAPLARGERLMIAELSFDPMRDSAPASATETVSHPTADAALAAMSDLALAPVAEVPPAPEPAPEPVVEATPAPTPAPTPRPAPAAPVMTTSATTHEAELRMLGLMNLSRVNAGLAPLALDAGVSEAARRHSAVEAQHRYVYHDGPDGTAKSRYVPACGSGWYGENTGKVWGGGVDVLHREFMAEPWEPINHRTNIMDPNFRRAGIGAVQGPDALYITVAFCR
jgi:uncharacterized protein YkwD